jgi:aryl-alcohol dehydrogenase-like predicted oxidoreductase
MVEAIEYWKKLEVVMRIRRLGNTDLELTVVGLGTWAMGGQWQYGWGPQDDADSVAAIFEAIDSGINWIDTAAVYGCGHSEEVVGKALKEMAEKPMIATKCGLLWNEKREKVNCLERASIVSECHASLRRLGVEVIDLYQMHWPEPDEQIEEAWEAMAQLVKQGKVRYLGVSNYSTSQIERVGGIYPVASLQPAYSMIHRAVEKELLDYCKSNNIGVVCYSPMQLGLLTGKFSAERMANLPADDHRRTSPDFTEPGLSANLKLVEGLRPVAQRSGRSLAQLAVAWVLRRKEVTSAIVGARRAGQIVETAQAGDWELANDDIAEIEGLLSKRKSKLSC